MRFNDGKCHIMHISSSRVPLSFMYELCGQVLFSAEEAQYLGVTLTSELSWSPHINSIANRVNVSLGYLKRNLKHSPSQLKEVVLNKNCTSTHGARTGPVQRRTNFTSPCTARRFLMLALQVNGPRTGLDIVNSPCGDHKGPIRARAVKHDAPAGFLPIMLVSIPLGVRKGAVRHPCGSCMGPERAPVGYENIEGSHAGPVRCSYRHHTGYPWSPANYSTKP